MPDTPATVPVVNEVAEALRVYSGYPSDGPPEWLERNRQKRLGLAEAVLDCPQVRAAFEAQAKLEAAEGLLRKAAFYMPSNISVGASAAQAGTYRAIKAYFGEGGES